MNTELQTYREDKTNENFTRVFEKYKYIVTQVTDSKWYRLRAYRMEVMSAGYHGLWRAIDTFEEPGNFVKYAYVCVDRSIHGIVWKWVNTKSNQKLFRLSVYNFLKEGKYKVGSNFSKRWDDDPTVRVENHEYAEKVLDQIFTNEPPLYKTLFTEKFIHNLTWEQIWYKHGQNKWKDGETLRRVASQVILRIRKQYAYAL